MFCRTRENNVCADVHGYHEPLLSITRRFVRDENFYAVAMLTESGAMSLCRLSDVFVLAEPSHLCIMAIVGYNFKSPRYFLF